MIFRANNKSYVVRLNPYLDILTIRWYRAREWIVNHKLHRENGPAMICSDGARYWYRNNKLHREDGPAYMGPRGERYWYKEGGLHWDDI